MTNSREREQRQRREMNELFERFATLVADAPSMQVVRIAIAEEAEEAKSRATSEDGAVLSCMIIDEIARQVETMELARRRRLGLERAL